MQSAIDTVLRRIEESYLIGEGQVIIVGFSGGPDSLCLLDALVKMSEPMKLTIVPVHINHMLREAAGKEQKHAEKLCARYGIEPISIEADCKELAEEEKLSIEEAGRVIRYGIFHNVAESFAAQIDNPDAVSIAVAHNADDQSETVLFRIIRGTGIHGLAGIRPFRMDPDFPIIRPLLDVTRTEIEAYIKDAELEPNIDESNFETEYSRNKLRLELIPEIEKKYNPKFRESLRHLADMALLDDDCMRNIALDVLDANSEFIEDDNSGKIIINSDKIIEMHIAIARRVVQIIFEHMGIEESLSYSLVSEVINIMLSGNPSAKMTLPGGISVSRRYGKTMFEIPMEGAEEEQMPLKEHRLIASVMTIEEYEKNKHKVHAAFDYNAFDKAHSGQVGDILIRHRASGDVLPIKGGKNKKIQNLFVDEKISQADRDKIELAAIGNEILWVIPSEFLSKENAKIKGIFSQKYQINDASREVIFLEIV